MTDSALLVAGYAAGKNIGLLGLEFPTRRRNRVNGIIEKVEDGRMHVHVIESFGNCPKYIQVGGAVQLCPSNMSLSPVICDSKASPRQAGAPLEH
jgi:hypothetical protein